MRKDRYRVVVNGHSAKSTVSKRGAKSLAQLARDHDLAAHVEKTDICSDCGLHRHGGEDICPDAPER